MSQPFLITGCGRSGTTWSARLFSRLGIQTWHERQFSPTSAGPLVISEASWLAMPYIDQLPSDTPILRVVRNPYDVVASVMQLDFQVGRPDIGNEHDAFLVRHSSFITEPDDKLARAIRWVATWDYALGDIDHEMMFVDRVSAREVTAVVRKMTGDASITERDVRWAVQQVGTNVNHKRRTRPVVTHRDIDAHHEGWRVRRRAEFFGYR